MALSRSPYPDTGGPAGPERTDGIPILPSALPDLLARLPDLVFHYQVLPERGFLYLSPAAEALTGYTPQELCSDPGLFFRIVHPDDRHLVTRILEGDAPENGAVTLRWIRKDGSLAWIELRSFPVRDTAGQVSAIQAIARDITGQVRTAALCRENETMLQTVSDLNAGISHLSARLLRAESVQDVADMALDQALRLTGSAYGYVGYIDPATGNLISPTLTRDIWDQCGMRDKAVVFERFTGLWGWVLRNRQPLLTNDPGADERSCGIPAGHIPITRLLSVPALLGGELVGQITVANAARDYTADDQTALEQLAALCALGIRHRQAVDALSESELRFRTLFQGSPDAYFLADIKSGEIIDANPAAEALTGLARTRIAGLHHANLHPVRVRKPARELFSSLVERTGGGPAQPVESLLLRSDGTEVPVELSAQVITLGGRMVLFTAVRDVSTRRQMVDELRRSEERYRHLLASVTNYIYTVTVEGGRATHTVHGPGCESVTGYRPDEFTADPLLWLDMIHPDDRQEVLDRTERLLRGETVPPVEHRVTHKNGSTIWIRNTFVSRFGAGGGLIAYDGLITDITGRRTAEEFVRTILETVDQGFLVIDRTFRILSANKAYADQLGRAADALAGMRCHEVTHGLPHPCFENGEACAVQSVFQTGRPLRVDHLHHDGAGNAIPVETKAFPLRDSSGSVVAAIEIVSNVSERKKLEDQLRHAQKMEAVGLLAGGIAHDFNNILTAIMGYGNLLDMKLGPTEPLRSYVEQILASASRAATLTQSLLAFSRKQVINPLPLGVNDLITRIRRLLVKLIGEDIELITVLSPDELAINADAVQVEQVLMNLAANARDAMRGGGQLFIETGAAVIDDAFRREQGFGTAGPYASISVRDTGAGMDERTRARVFEPFFTTKETGGGSGLGLSVVYGIMKQNNGYVLVSSEPGRGSTFTLLFPLIDAPAAQDGVQESGRVLGGSETILIAEDDPELRKVTAAMLREFGYRVIEAIDGSDAVEKFMASPDAIRLVILDSVMPRKSGRDACSAIRSARPSTPVLFISGYSPDVISAKGLLVEGVPVVQKPVSPTELLCRVRGMLDGVL